MNHLDTTAGARRLLLRFLFVVSAAALAISCSSDEALESLNETVEIGGVDAVDAGAVEADVVLEADAEAEPGREADADEPTSAPLPVEEGFGPAAEALASGVVLEAHDMKVDEVGVQVRVERIVQRSDATFVRLAVVNGSDEDRELPHHQKATLTLADGSTVDPVDAFPSRGVSLDQGESSIVVLVYPPIEGRFDLEVGVDGTLDSAFSPLVVFDFADLDAGRSAKGLQGDAALAAVGTHPNSTQIELDGIRFTPDRIGVNISFRNGHSRDLWLFGAHDTFLEDDLGNRYRALVEPNGNSFYELETGASLSGVLTFAGRMDPRATSYTIFINDGGLLTNPLANSPAFVLGPFEVGADQFVDTLPADIDVDATIERSTGWSATWSAVRFDDESITVDLSVINGSDTEAEINTDFISLIDSEGIKYQSQPIEESEFVLEPGEGFEGEIVFGGRLQPAATTVELDIRNYGAQQSFFFDPIEVGRSNEAATLSSFEVTDFSSFVVDALESSSISEIAGAIAQFDGVEVEGGVMLTLPETILFDFGESTLRPDSAASIALVADILEFYEGDRVRVVGHTDSIGDDASNLALSIDRANAVLDGLVAQGVDADLLSIEGRGESQPVAPNAAADGTDDPDGRQLNRRVEIFIDTTKGIPQG